MKLREPGYVREARALLSDAEAALRQACLDFETASNLVPAHWHAFVGHAWHRGFDRPGAHAVRAADELFADAEADLQFALVRWKKEQAQNVEILEPGALN